jgi:hypothetical protein
VVHLELRPGYENFYSGFLGLKSGGWNSHKGAEKCHMPEYLPVPALHISLKRHTKYNLMYETLISTYSLGFTQMKLTVLGDRPIYSLDNACVRRFRVLDV